MQDVPIAREEHLRGDLGTRLLLFFERGDPSGVLADATIVNIVELLRAGGDPNRDHDLAFTIGWLHWGRYLTIESGSEDRELAVAEKYLEIVHRTQPEGVPDPLRPYFDSPPGSRGQNQEAIQQRAATLVAVAKGSEQATRNAIAFLRKAAAATAPGHPYRRLYLNELGNILAARFERTGNVDDIDSAVDSLRDGLGETSGDHPERGLLLVNLGGNLRIRFEYSGSPADLAESVKVSEEAVALIPPGDERRVAAVSTLGAILRRRFERTGCLPDLDRAIELDAEAVDGTPEQHARYAMYVSNLAVAFRSRYEATGELVDLDSALSLGLDALRRTPRGDPEFPRLASNLSVAIFRRFDRTEDEAELEQAVNLGNAALAGTPPGSPVRFARVSCLADVLFRRAQHRNDAADLDKAIELYRQTAELLPADHPDRIALSSTLCAAYLRRAKRSEETGDLDAAIEAGQQAADRVPVEHPHRAGAMSNLAAALSTRDEPGDLERAVAAYEAAAASTSSPASLRALAACRRAQLAGREGDWPVAAEAYASAIDLLSRVAGRGLSRNSQQAQLGTLSGLAPAAVAACLEAGTPETAVELWEQGRGVLIAQALESRGDLGELSQRDAALAAEFLELSRILNGTLASGAEVNQRELALRREAGDRLERLVETIRELPGFERFLRPPAFEDLLATASEGPVVIVNLDFQRSDALILTDEGLRVVPLPDLVAEDAATNVGKYFGALEDRTEGPLNEVLAWLWESVCKPVLTALGPTLDAGARTRIWWCPTGLLGFLPLHAACALPTPEGSGGEAVLDRVVSSYTPTLRTLIHARGARSETPPGGPTVLGVAMAATPAAEALPGAEREALLLESLFGRRAEILRDEEAKRSEVLAGLEQHPWAHFACHGSAQIPNPSSSALLLTDHREQPLTVYDLSQLHLDGAELAYLSACSTARAHPFIPDEAIHLASAFQIAGYRQVVATLWEIDDDQAVELAAHLYEKIEADGVEVAATALHEATLASRRRHPDAPSLWASHIHCGA